jgi:DNA-binding MarR family transcriptional regulator
MAHPGPPFILRIWRDLHLVDALVCEELNARLAAQVGCSLVEHDLLAWVFAAPSQRLRMLELAGLLRVTPGGLTRIVDRTVERGWIRRERPAGNRREVYAVLTEEGRALLRSARPAYLGVLQETIAGHLTQAELATLLDVSQKLLDRLGPGRGPGPDQG